MKHKTAFPHLKRLKVEISEDEYVMCADLNKALDKKQRALFNKYFGIQTCPMDGQGRPALYAWDAESVLTRMFESGKLTGSQKHWD